MSFAKKAFIAGIALLSFASPALADISISPMPAASSASLVSSGTNITICSDISGSAILIGQTAPATYNDGSYEMRPGDGCHTIDWTTTNHDAYGDTLVGSRAYYAGNYFNGGNNVTATIYVCASGSELTMDSSLATGCGSGPVPPPAPIPQWTYGTSTCEGAGYSAPITGSTTWTTYSTSTCAIIIGAVIAYDPFLDVMLGIFGWFALVGFIVWFVLKFK